MKLSWANLAVSLPIFDLTDKHVAPCTPAHGHESQAHLLHYNVRQNARAHPAQGIPVRTVYGCIHTYRMHALLPLLVAEGRQTWILDSIRACDDGEQAVLKHRLSVRAPAVAHARPMVLLRKKRIRRSKNQMCAAHLKTKCAPHVGRAGPVRQRDGLGNFEDMIRSDNEGCESARKQIGASMPVRVQA